MRQADVLGLVPEVRREDDVTPTAWILYRNHRGETAWREISPLKVRFGSTLEHREACWMLRAVAHDRGDAERDFKMACIIAWSDEMPAEARDVG